LLLFAGGLRKVARSGFPEAARAHFLATVAPLTWIESLQIGVIQDEEIE
jgi:hypothetical protein